MSEEIRYYCDQKDDFEMLYCQYPNCNCNTISDKVKIRIKKEERERQMNIANNTLARIKKNSK